MMVVANLYQLNRFNGVFTKEGKKAIMTGVVLAEDYVKNVNESSKESGKYYEIDEKATEKYHKDGEVITKEREAEKLGDSVGAEALAAALLNKVEAKESKKAGKAKESDKTDK